MKRKFFYTLFITNLLLLNIFVQSCERNDLNDNKETDTNAKVLALVSSKEYQVVFKRTENFGSIIKQKLSTLSESDKSRVNEIFNTISKGDLKDTVQLNNLLTEVSFVMQFDFKRYLNNIRTSAHNLRINHDINDIPKKDLIVAMQKYNSTSGNIRAKSSLEIDFDENDACMLTCAALYTAKLILCAAIPLPLDILCVAVVTTEYYQCISDCP